MSYPPKIRWLLALDRLLNWLECVSCIKGLQGSIPHQNTHLGFRFYLQLGSTQEAIDRCFYLTSMLIFFKEGLWKINSPLRDKSWNKNIYGKEMTKQRASRRLCILDKSKSPQKRCEWRLYFEENFIKECSAIRNES